MNFRREKANNLYLRDTQVENIFLTEYMPGAEGDFVKVYLTALMYAGDEKMSNSLIAKHLGMAEEDVLRAWNYWESCGVIRKRGLSEDRFHYTVEFTCLKEKLFLTPKDAEEAVSEENAPEEFNLQMNDEELRKTFDAIEEITGRMLESRESSAVVNWIYDEGLSPDLICFAYRFCAEKRGNSRFPYVSSVIRDWERENIRTAEEAKRYLEDTDLRHNQYRRVMKALGFHRNPTEKEQDLIDSWFDQLGFDIGKILEACAKTSGISNPNINYVNSILLAWSGRDTKNVRNGSDAGGTAKGGNPAVKVKKMYEDLRRRKEAELEERRRSVYASIPRVREIDTQIRRTSLEISRLALHGSGEMERERLNRKITDLGGEKAFLLTENNLPYDYLEMQHDCKYCKDTGVLNNGERCRCYSEKLKQFI